MSRRSSSVFNLIIGAIFVAEYFIGFDGRGSGAGETTTLLFGIVFVGYGIYGLMESAPKGG